MPSLRPDPTFYPSAKQAAEAPPEELAYLAMLSPNESRPDAIGVVDDRGPQQLAYDFAWHLGHDTTITSEWGTPRMVRDGLVPELLLSGKYGHALHVWNLRNGRHQQSLDLGPQYQVSLELRAARDPRRRRTVSWVW